MIRPMNLTPQAISSTIIMILCGIAGYWGAKRATAIQKRAAAKTPPLVEIPDVEERERMKMEVEPTINAWFDGLNNAIGVFLLVGAASAAQSTYPAVAVFSVLLLVPAIAPSITKDEPNILWALREKKDKSPFDEAFHRYLRKTYTGFGFHRGFLFWLGYIATLIPLTQAIFSYVMS